MKNNRATKTSWKSLYGWYHTGDVVWEKLQMLKRGSISEQEKALSTITQEIEHQGGISYLAPFAIRELTELLINKQTQVDDKVMVFLKELEPVVDDYLEQVDDKLYETKKDYYNFEHLLKFLSQHSDEEGANSLWETGDAEGMDIAHVLIKSLITDLTNKDYD